MIKNRGRGSIPVWIAALLVMLVALAGCSRMTTKRTVNSRNAATPEQEDTSMLEGVVVKNDTANRQLIMQELGSEIQTTLSYDSVTEVTDKYGSLKEGEKVEAGEIFEATYTLGQGKIATLRVPEDVWEYQEVTSYTVDNEERSLEFADRKYQYSNLTYISSSGQNIEMMELNEQDVLTVRGTGYTVHSIVRTQGHGYIRLKNYRQFIGGMVEVGNGIILPVTKNMLITAREGTYRIILCKGSMSAVKTATVQMDKECTLDFSDYESAAQKIGTITFRIIPKGADLTINGTAVDYSKPLPLLYGSYRLNVTMTGYPEYSGILKVARPSDIVTVNLINEKTSVSDTTPAPADSSDNSSKGVTTKKIDSDHTITVSAPEGAEVFLDNVYKGVVPCTFTKVLGSQTLTLRKEGYLTKSYSIDILDDGQNTTLSFSELPEDADDSTSSTAAPSATETAGPSATSR